MQLQHYRRSLLPPIAAENANRPARFRERWLLALAQRDDFIGVQAGPAIMHPATSVRSLVVGIKRQQQRINTRRSCA
jgi:hypothetical protein